MNLSQFNRFCDREKSKCDFMKSRCVAKNADINVFGVGSPRRALSNGARTVPENP